MVVQQREQGYRQHLCMHHHPTPQISDGQLCGATK
eukprot:COSAG01_NODE_494_length_16322_cov_35.380879_14_plen_35_part_00